MKPLLLAALLLVAPVAAAQDWRDADPTLLAAEAAQQAHASRLVAALERDGGARERALAVLLRAMERQQQALPGGGAPSRPVPSDPQAGARLREALAKAGDDTLALQLLAAAAVDHPDLRQEAVRRWREAEPDNLVPLLYANLAGDALLAQARDATRADARMYEGVRWIMSTLRRHPPTAAEQSALAAGGAFDPATFAAMPATSLWAATVMPGYDLLLEACSERMLRAMPARTADCRRVATLLADHADTAVGVGVGVAILRASADTPAATLDATERTRTMDWRMLEWGRAAMAQADGGAAQFARLLDDPSIRTELELAGRVLQEAGVAAYPPDGWTPPGRSPPR